MLLSTLMTGVTPNPAFTGWSTNDDMVFAIDLDPTAVSPTAIPAYAVVQLGIEGLDAQLNPIMTEKNYIRAGQSSIKTGNQRTFKVTGDRYLGDGAQDFMLSHAVAQGRGSACVTNYVYFNLLTGKGEQGQVSIIVNSDASGNAGEASTIDIELKKVGAAPTEYTWTPGTVDAVALSTIVPADAATSISKTASVVLTFNNPIAMSSVSLIDSTSGDIVANSQAWDAAKKVLTLTPSSALTGLTKYIVAVNGVEDVYGQQLAATSKEFTTVA